MRKVTASAVILTALTGCSQSGSIPSSQWSFEVPSDGEISRSHVPPEGGALVASGSSKDSRSFAKSTANRRVMGPAFEQPAASAAVEATSAISADSKEVSTLSTETYALTSGLPTARRSTRPDPVAQVRAYLRASGSPSALTSRAPYNSQAYLSTLPTPNQYYDPALISAVSTPAVGIVDLDLTESSIETSPSTGAVPPIDVGAADGSINLSVAPASLDVASAAPDIESVEAVSYSDDGLPQLVAAAVPFTADEAVPIGTAILNNLQQSSKIAAEAASAPLAQAAIAPAPRTSPVVANPVVANDVVGDDVAVGDATANDAMVNDAVGEAIADETITYPPAVQVSSRASTSTPSAPTLASLTRTMPRREVSPLVASYRANDGRVQPAELVPDALSDFSASETLESNIRDLSNPMESDLHTEADSLPENTQSPLLDSFRESEPVSTLYVPISDPVSADVSDVLTQNAIDELGEVSTSDFVNRLVEMDTFSAVLSSPALVNSSARASGKTPSIAQRIPLNSASRKRPIKVFTDQRVKGARNAAITLAAKQASKRRQRLSWL